MTQESSIQSSLGRKIEGIRRIRGISQETLASSLKMSRQGLYKMEQAEVIDDEKLQQIAEALGVSVETIKNFNEDAVINYIQNNYDGSNKQGMLTITNDHCTFNPIDKIVELYDELLKSEREKIELLKSMLDKK